jgi:glucan phosphorylase
MLQPADAPGIIARDAFKHAFLDNLLYTQGKFPALATQNDYYLALAYTVRDHLLQRWISTAAAYTRQGSRVPSASFTHFRISGCCGGPPNRKNRKPKRAPRSGRFLL